VLKKERRGIEWEAEWEGGGERKIERENVSMLEKERRLVENEGDGCICVNHSSDAKPLSFAAFFPSRLITS